MAPVCNISKEYGDILNFESAVTLVEAVQATEPTSFSDE